MNLQALLGGESRLAVVVPAWEGLHPQVDEEVLLEVGVLREVLLAVGTDVLLLLLVDLFHVTVQRVLGAQDHLALSRERERLFWGSS